MKKLFLFIGVFFLSILFPTCKKEKGEPIDAGYDYFPTMVGSWIIYDVDSIIHDDFTQTSDTFYFQIKEVIESTFLDNSGRETQRIERYKKETDTTGWVIKDVWFSNLTTTTAEKVEENVRFIKLTFPVKQGYTWDGNAYNTEETWDYEYTEVDVPRTINTLSFDTTLTVLQIDKILWIEKKYSVEQYAKHVGLIYKHYISFDFQAKGIDIAGVEYTMTINSYGNK